MQNRFPSKKSHEDDDEAIVVCMPVTTGTAITGSMQRNCLECSEPIWVSPGTLKSVEDFPQRKFICAECALKNHDLANEPLEPPTELQMKELERHFEQARNKKKRKKREDK